MRFLLVSCLVLFAWPAFAAPVDPALQKQLLAAYDAFNVAIAKGQYDQAVAQRSAASQKVFKQQLKTAQDRKSFMEMNKAITPEKLDVVHSKLSKDGNKASLITHASRVVPAGLKDPGAPPAGTVLTSELTIDFVKEGGKWKYESQTLGMDPAAVKRCEDTKFEPAEAYDESKDVSAGGPIVRVEFKQDHTLVVFKVLDEENCGFLPDKETLAKGGFDTSLLTPYTVISLEGFKHKTSQQKILVQMLDILEEN